MAAPKPFSGNCKFCDRLIRNKASLVSHEKRCRNNPDKVTWVSGGFDWKKDPKYAASLELQKARSKERANSPEARERRSASLKGYYRAHPYEVSEATRARWKANKLTGE